MGQNSTIAKWASKLLKNEILDYDEKDVTLVFDVAASIMHSRHVIYYYVYY
ncbi:hypothetical protein HanXRQr2_Chr01g0030181 [Helianthus annuus]|uniref:Uncharacterized protein n=1 Tax=Helianthus annuus TaxID=4232 RepID=A0A9K3JY38_HELAN|nr:hypothetical protein HanXRQr2_Chr01g0030181 [Helianthus annuus]KAJ0957592.1 hypothetical protein HanPSC8_Chr01g0029441 [Helianthus annuus]